MLLINTQIPWEIPSVQSSAQDEQVEQWTLLAWPSAAIHDYQSLQKQVHLWYNEIPG